MLYTFRSVQNALPSIKGDNPKKSEIYVDITDLLSKELEKVSSYIKKRLKT
jgi:hypothetical protein